MATSREREAEVTVKREDLQDLIERAQDPYRGNPDTQECDISHEALLLIERLATEVLRMRDELESRLLLQAPGCVCRSMGRSGTTMWTCSVHGHIRSDGVARC